jgi:hypothetical protein
MIEDITKTTILIHNVQHPEKPIWWGELDERAIREKLKNEMSNMQ